MAQSCPPGIRATHFVQTQAAGSSTNRHSRRPRPASRGRGPTSNAIPGSARPFFLGDGWGVRRRHPAHRLPPRRPHAPPNLLVPAGGPRAPLFFGSDACGRIWPGLGGVPLRRGGSCGRQTPRIKKRRIWPNQFGLRGHSVARRCGTRRSTCRTRRATCWRGPCGWGCGARSGPPPVDDRTLELAARTRAPRGSAARWRRGHGRHGESSDGRIRPPRDRRGATGKDADRDRGRHTCLRSRT